MWKFDGAWIYLKLGQGQHFKSIENRVKFICDFLWVWDMTPRSNLISIECNE